MVIQNKDAKIKELEGVIEGLQYLRVENDVLNNKMHQMEKKMFELTQQIKSFNQASTIARKIEHNHQNFYDQLMKMKRSTSPNDSNDYIHITKFRKLKEQLMAEKCHSRDIEKEMYGLQNMIKNLRISNVKLQETVKHLVKSTEENMTSPGGNFGDSRRKINRSIGGVRQPTPLKGSEITSHFISKHMDKLRQHVNDFDVFRAVYETNNEKELKKLSVKRIELLKNLNGGKSVMQQETDHDSDYSQDFISDTALKERVKKRENLNKTVSISERDSILDAHRDTDPTHQRNQSEIRVKRRSGTPSSRSMRK